MGRYGSATTILGRLPSGLTVTMSLYKASDGSSVAITNTCTEIGSTGVFRWATSNITTQPTVETEYFYRMVTGDYQYEGKFSLISVLDAVYARIGAPAGASIAADLVTIDNFVDELESRITAARAGYLDNLSAGAVALAATALSDVTWTDAKAGYIDAEISGRAPANEYDTQMGYIPANLGDVPTAAELIAAHGSGAWTTADVSALATSAEVAAVPSDVWDEILTGATHNIATSAGRRLREVGAYAIESGTAQGGNSHSITLAATATANDGIYNRNLLVLTDNTGVGQTRTIVDYNGTTKVAVVDRDWKISPDATTEYQVTPADTPLVVDHGVAQGGTANTLTLRAVASAVDGTYEHGIITILAGTGQGQIRLLHSYDGTTKVATICGDDWVTTPDTTSVYVIMPYGVTSTGCIAPDVLRDLMKTAGVLL